ncbi:unnamed protein product [Rotaria sp. Silwood1]|nr:unnamed protein product [Rotaria sp. Silwood1]CAF3516764.1 unnamed protein product [Rotaria sp. Silwood1]CAF4838257.1 unnamed protein product [Rotaria sp. Silwood1]
MLSIISHNRPVSFHQVLTLLTSSIRYLTSTSSDRKSDGDADYHDRLNTTKKMRLLGLQSSQARQALSIYDDYVNRQKKLPDLRMFAVAINCAMIAEDLAKGREIHQFIEHNFPHLKDNLMLKQQLRYFYIKCNDKLSADKLFQQSSTIKHAQTEIQQKFKTNKS